MDHISFSQIDCFKCPFRYKTLYIDKSISKESLYMTSGKVAHDSIRAYSKECIKKKIESDFQIMEDVISEAMQKEKTTFEQDIGIREDLLQFAEKNIGFDTLLDYEKEFNIDLENGVINGFIDRTNSYRDDQQNRCLDIIDYKYSFKNYTESEVDALLQLRIYRWAAIKHLYKNYDQVRLGIYNIRYNFIRWGKSRSVESLEKEFEGIEKFLNDQWTKIKEADGYPVNKSEACLQYGGCPVLIKGICPAYSKDEIKKLINSENIIDQVHAVRALQSQLADALSKLKTYFSNNIPISVDGEVVGYSASISYKYTLKALKYLEETYKTNIDMIPISKTEVEKILKKLFGKKYEEYLPELNDFRIETSQNKFEV